MGKKIFLLLLALAILAGHPFATSAAMGAEEESPQINVMTTVFSGYDFVRQITGGKARITLLLPPGTESHSYEPTPQDIVRIQSSDVFVYVGGENEAWVDRMLSVMDTANMRLVAMMDCVDVVQAEIVEGMEAGEHGHGDEHEDEGEQKDDGPEYDEHVWTSPKNAKRIVQKLCDALAEADPENAGAYRLNTAAYLDQLDALDAAFQEVVGQAVRKTVVFGDRFPFRYLADAYGLTYSAAFPGCSTETEPSFRTVAFLIDKVQAEGIPVVFHIELSNEKMADVICEATGAQKLLLHACHNITKDDFDRGATYLELMTRNVAALKEALW